jgi:hypothetical protein
VGSSLTNLLSRQQFPSGHPQHEHETSHGSMSKVRFLRYSTLSKVLTIIYQTEWVVDGDDDTVVELQGHKFAAADGGAPMLCSLFCTAQGRHAHIDYCRALSARECGDPEVSHITAAIRPNPARAKDWVTHELHWQRLGMFPSSDILH